MLGKFIGVGVATAAIGIAKRIPNDRIKRALKPVFYRAGVVVTLGMAKSPVMGPIWNKTVEPYVVDLLDNVLFAMRYGFIPGLRSDNPDQPPGPAEGAPPPEDKN